MSHLFTGTGVAVVTPFDRSWELDLASLTRLIEHIISGGAEYLVVLGTTGESATLTLDEKERVIDHFNEVNQGRVPLVLGVGGNHTREVRLQLEYLAPKYNPSGILSVSPYYNKPSQEGIYQHYKAVAGSTNLPVILYNVPGRTASNINSETVLRLAHEVDNIVAVKEASGDFEQGMEIIKGRPEGFLVLSGDDILTLPLIACGYDGVISVTANALSRDFSDMVRAALAGHVEEAQSLHYKCLKFMQLNFQEGNPAGVKMLLHQMGICESYVRLPLTRASEKLAEAMKKELAPA